MPEPKVELYDELWAWRYWSFREMGFCVEDAEKAADAELSPHELEGLIKKGCALDLALRISL